MHVSSSVSWIDRRIAAALLSALSVGLLGVGCGGDDDGGTDGGGGMVDSGTADSGGGTVDSGGGTDAGADGSGAGTDGGAGSAWVVRTHDCPGINRTDALWVDDDHTIWIGCGSGAEGAGLYVSEDDGETWSIPATNPAGVLSSFRVLSIHRGFGGLVYVAGQGPSRSAVISLDTSATPYAAAPVLNRGMRVGTSFLVGPFVTTSTGAAFADSFNGHDALYRPDDTVGPAASEWTLAGDWEFPSGSHQILDMVVRDDRFVAVGSTIAEPPYVFVPAAGGEPYSMTPVQLVSGLGEWRGEMWGVAANASRIVAVGVDQDNDVGKIFVSGADETNPADYTQIDIDPLVPAADGSDSTWARGVCMDGDRIAVVGEVQPLAAGDNSGFVLLSTDGGASFTDMTPEGSPATWSKCQFVGSRLVVAGAGAIALRDDL